MTERNGDHGLVIDPIGSGGDDIDQKALGRLSSEKRLGVKSQKGLISVALDNRNQTLLELVYSSPS